MIKRASTSFEQLHSIRNSVTPLRNDPATIYTRPRLDEPNANSLPYPQMGVRGMPTLARPLPYPASGSGGMPMPMPMTALPYPEDGIGGMPVRAQPYPLLSAPGMPIAPLAVLPLAGFQSTPAPTGLITYF